MNLHQNHKIIRIDDEESFKKENLTIDSSAKNFIDDIQKLDNLKASIENEMIKIDKAYEKVDKETTEFYESKRQKLKEEEENLKD